MPCNARHGTATYSRTDGRDALIAHTRQAIHAGLRRLAESLLGEGHTHLPPGTVHARALSATTCHCTAKHASHLHALAEMPADAKENAQRMDGAPVLHGGSASDLTADRQQ